MIAGWVWGPSVLEPVGMHHDPEMSGGSLPSGNSSGKNFVRGECARFGTLASPSGLCLTQAPFGSKIVGQRRTNPTDPCGWEAEVTWGGTGSRSNPRRLTGALLSTVCHPVFPGQFEPLVFPAWPIFIVWPKGTVEINPALESMNLIPTKLHTVVFWFEHCPKSAL